MPKKNDQIPEANIAQMFNSIAPRYDILNRVLSFGLDLYWRRKTARVIKSFSPKSLLDIATGSGDLLTAITKQNPQLTNVVGSDISTEMLKLAQKKLKTIQLIKAPANKLPLDDNTFNCITIGFGIRNFSDKIAALVEIKRLLKPNGKIVILEFATPPNPIIRKFYLLYLRHIVPIIGRIFTKNAKAYKYLNTSIEDFGPPEKLRKILTEAGFADITTTPLTFGIVCIYTALPNKGAC